MAPDTIRLPPGPSDGPPIRLLALGPPSLMAPPGEVRAVVQQPKRLAFLTFLVLRGGDWVARDELLAHFWPDLDGDHARAALRRALYFLRSELGAEVVRGRADGRVQVDPGEIWCDAIVFREAMTRHESAEALPLYRGQFLEGVFVSGAPAVERWLDAERANFARLAGRAAWALVDAPGLSAEEVIGRAYRAAALAPEDEAGLRRLVTLLDQAGDRLGALRTYQEFVHHLSHELGAEPSGETRALADRLRSPGSATGPLTSRPVHLRTSPSEPDLSLVAICPFEVDAPASLGYLGSAAMQLLSATLGGAGPVRTVEPAAILAAIARARVKKMDQAEGLRIARHFAAGYYLVGSVIESGGRLRALATLFAGDGTPRDRFEAEVKSESLLFELMDAIAGQVLTAVADRAWVRLARSAIRATSSLPALKHYLAGEEAMRAGRPEAGREAFMLATQVDGTFALAHDRLAGSFASAGLIEMARDSSARAFEHRTRLGDPERQLVEAHHAWLDGRVDQAEHLYQTVASAWPQTVAGWFHLGDVLFHANPERGRKVEEARFPFDRVLELDPDHVGALVHLARLDALAGRRTEAVRHLRHALERNPSPDLGFSLRVLLAHLGDSRTERDAVIAELPSARAVAIANAFAEIALHARDLEGAVVFGRAALGVARTDEFRALCHFGLAHLLLALDQEGDAADEFDQVAAIRPVWATAARAQLLVLPGAVVSEDALAKARSEVLALPAAPSPLALPLILQAHEALFPHVRLYLLGLLAIRAGEVNAAVETAEEMAETEVPGGSVAPIQRFSRTLEAELLRCRGRVAEAVERLQRPGPAIWYQFAAVSPFFTGMHERLLHGLVLRETGSERAARAWWATIGRRSPYELAALPNARRLLTSG